MIAEAQWFMPVWLQIVVSISIVAIAVGVIWRKILKPGANLISLLDKALPMLKELVEQFEDHPHAFAILNEIARQFKTDSGSSLRDVINRLEKAANENKASAIKLEVNLEAERQLAEQSRTQVAKLTAIVSDVSVKVSQLQIGARRVATELGAAQQRATDITSGEAGEAADAAAQKPKDK